MSQKRNILVVYWYNSFPVRTSVVDHLYCFRRYSNDNVFYLNVAHHREPPAYLKMNFDLIVFHDLFFCGRWGGRELFEDLVGRVQYFKESPALKVAIPQDEFIHGDLLCEFIRDFQVQHVFSVSPPSEWSKIYKDVDFSSVQFHLVLTGYLDDGTLSRIERLCAIGKKRSIEIGYRAGGRNWRQAAWLGRHGALKIEIAEAFQIQCQKRGYVSDISTRSEDTLLGDDWYRFLSECRFTIGVEGGASILDWDGAIRQKTLAYVQQNKDCTREQIEADCFPGQEGSLSLFALSPRHLEAAATKTCQILVEGSYNGVLKPGTHYIELKRDFSNIDSVFDQIQDTALVQKLVDQAYLEIVASGSYSYRTFVKLVLDTSRRPTLAQVAPVFLSRIRNQIADEMDWMSLRLNFANGLWSWPRLLKGFLRNLQCGFWRRLRSSL